jgi:hypothetical protein
MATVDKAKIYNDLLSLKITLNFEDIPSPAYIQDRIFECNEQSRKVEKHCIQIKQEYSEAKRHYKLEKFNFDARKRQALTNNEKIKKLPTGKEREAAVEELFEDDLRKLVDLENEVNSLKDLLEAIEMVQNNIKSTSTDIRMLARVMEQQINRLNIGTKEDPEMASINAMYSNLDKQMKEDLDKEMNLDDVESSTETMPDASGDELESGTPITVSLDEDGQDAPDSTESESGDESDAGEHSQSTPVDGQETEEGKEDGADALDSFLVDDSEDGPMEKGVDDDSREEEETTSETSEEPQQATSQPQEVEVDSDEAASANAPANPKVELDLDALGIDIETEDVVQAPKPEKEKVQKKTSTESDKKPVETTPASKKDSAPKKQEASAAKTPPAEKKEPAAVTPPPAEKKAETPKKDITDVDLEEILSSF